MTQGTGPVTQPDYLSSFPGPNGAGVEMTPANCPLASTSSTTCHICSHVYIGTHMHELIN